MERLERERDQAAAAAAAQQAPAASPAIPVPSPVISSNKHSFGMQLPDSPPRLAVPSSQGDPISSATNPQESRGAAADSMRASGGIDPAILEAAMQEWRTAQACAAREAAQNGLQLVRILKA